MLQEQDSRMFLCNFTEHFFLQFHKKIHDIHFKTEAQVGLFVLNKNNMNCITLTSLEQQVSNVQGGFVTVIGVL